MAITRGGGGRQGVSAGWTRAAVCVCMLTMRVRAAYVHTCSVRMSSVVAATVHRVEGERGGRNACEVAREIAARAPGPRGGEGGTPARLYARPPRAAVARYAHLRRGRSGALGRLSLVHDDAVREVGRHDEVVLHDKRRLLRVHDEALDDLSSCEVSGGDHRCVGLWEWGSKWRRHKETWDWGRFGGRGWCG
eukprot:183977-Chlamydomonas_euryale.AAC.2